VYERAIAFFRIHYHLFYRTIHARRWSDPILSCGVGRILQYGLARRGVLLPITKLNLERYTRPDMSAHVFTWSIDSLAVYIRVINSAECCYFRMPAKDDGRLLRAEIHFHPGDMGHRPIAFRNTLPFFPPGNRIGLIDSPPAHCCNIIWPMKKKLRSEKTLWRISCMSQKLQ